MKRSNTLQVTLKKASRKDQDADASGEQEVKTEGDEEGTAVVALVVVRLSKLHFRYYF